MSVILLESLVCCFISFTCFLTCCRTVRCFDKEEEEHGEVYLFKPKISPRVVETDNTERDLECNICLEEYKIGEEIHTFKCGHTNHIKCCDAWTKERICPICQV